MTRSNRGVILVAHGTVDDLDELPAFIARIRRGHAAPPELVAEVRRRYQAIGGQSPLNAINRAVAAKVEARLGVPTRFANRLAAPFVGDVLKELAQGGAERVASVPLAQYSAKLYARAVEEAAKEAHVDVRCAESWAMDPRLIDAYVRSIDAALATVDRGTVTVVMTAHSLPIAAIRAGDSYEREVRASAGAIAERLAGVTSAVAFQSQGLSTGGGADWLGPDLIRAIDEARARGSRHVLFAPIGFLADHVEVLYDLDVEAKGWVEERGMTYARTRSLNDDDALVDVIAAIAQPLLDDGPA